ncbi:MAG: hypothetical protein EOP52_12425 [Sphingobacteriales bacterium]|nr:MAG: hypothetical protein EOP52_12425 [Sphingobacteriales bacterium]
MTRKETEQLYHDLTVLRNIVPGLLERVGRMLTQDAPARSAKKKIDRKAALTTRLLTGQHKPKPSV